MGIPENGCPECGSDECDVLWRPAATGEEEAELQCADCGAIYWDWLRE